MASDKEEIARDAWQKTLDGLTREHEGDVATIEVDELDLGDQFAAEEIPFSYVEYDPHDDAVSVGVGGLRRQISGGAAPRGRAPAERVHPSLGGGTGHD